MKVGFIGCVYSSKMALETLLDIDDVEVCAVITREQSSINNDFYDLSPLCKKKLIPYHYEDPNNRDESIKFLKQFDLDIIYCIGWSYLLGKEILEIPSMGVVGFHPAKLPANRGRHPIIWALALGLMETASTFFQMDSGADSGPLISQVVIPISKTDNAQSLYEKIINVAEKQIRQFTSELVKGTVTFYEQDHSLANYWRKRSRKDGIIDFRMSAESIYNLVRALAPPYPCAEFLWDGQNILVSKCSISKREFSKNLEPGLILDKKSDSLLVKTSGQQAIWLEEIMGLDIKIGEYL